MTNSINFIEQAWLATQSFKSRTRAITQAVWSVRSTSFTTITLIDRITWVPSGAELRRSSKRTVMRL